MYCITVIIKEGKQLSQLTVLTQALLVLTNYLKTAKAQSEVKILKLLATLTAKVCIVAERLTGTYQSSLRNLFTESVFQLQLPLALALVLAPALVIIPALALVLILVLLLESQLSYFSQLSLELEITGLPKHCISWVIKTVNNLQRKQITGL